MRQLWRNFCKNWQVLIGLIWFFGTGSLPFWAPSVLLSLKIPPESLRGFGLYLLGTGTAPLGLYLTYNRTASLRSQTDNEKDKNVTDAFARSVELLDGKSRATKQGGIYALEKIAKDNSERHSTIMKIMTSYVRGETYHKFHERLEREALTDGKLIDKLANEPMPSDIEAAIAVIRERQISNDESLKDSEESFKSKFDLSNAYLFNSEFGDTELLKTNFSDSKMVKCRFDGTDLSGSYFATSDLQGSSFVNSILKNCEFIGTNFQECDFERCDLSGSTFEKCDLRNIKNLTQEQINKAKIDEATKLPGEIKRPKGTTTTGNSTT